MPRTKLSKNAAAKRNRDSTHEERVNNCLLDFDTLVEDGLSDIDVQFLQEQDQINVLFSSFRGQLSQHILGLTIQEIRNMGVGTFDELNEASVIDPQATMSSLNSTGSIQNTRLSKLTRKNQSRDDEGYLTEESCQTAKKLPPRPKGPLSSAKQKLGRRSNSASSYLTSHTPLINKNQSVLMSSSKNLLSSKINTPAKNNTSIHSSRSKFRTPMTRVKAMSADRGMMAPVTPKVQMDTPLALLRYAKAGEHIISLSGSPVIAANHIMDHTANVNIPINNGVLSLRPQHMSSIDHEIIGKIDAATLNNLKQLQSNLNLIMRMAEDGH